MEGFPPGFKIHPVSEEKEELLKLYVGHFDSATVEVEPNGWVLPAAYKEYYKDYKNFQVRPRPTCLDCDHWKTILGSY